MLDDGVDRRGASGIGIGIGLGGGGRGIGIGGGGRGIGVEGLGEAGPLLGVGGIGLAGPLSGGKGKIVRREAPFCALIKAGLDHFDVFSEKLAFFLFFVLGRCLY